MAFGAGTHTCLGASVARFEDQMAIRKFLERFPMARRTDTTAPDWRAVPALRGISQLDVVVI